MFGLGDPYEDAHAGSDATASDATSPDATRLPVLIAHFSFDHDIDDDGGLYAGTANGGGVTIVPGHNGNALALDGAGCIAIKPPQMPAMFTIAFWAKPVVANDAALISRPYGGGLDTYAWRVYQTSGSSGTDFGFEIYDGHTSVDAVVATGLSLGDWHHYAVSFDGMTKSWWLDGTQIYTQSAAAASYTEVPEMFIGCQDPATHYFSGMIDDLYFYDGALAQVDIEALAAM